MIRPLAAAALLLFACGRPEVTVAGADGEKGRGTFATPWGVEELEYEWRNGERVHDWDWVLDPESELKPGQKPLLSSAYLKWQMDPATGQVVIPYVIENSGPVGQTAFDSTRANILRAMSHWTSRAPFLQFVPHSSQGRWVVFEVKQNSNVCYVALNANGRSRVDSDPSCRWQTYVHELGHVLTFRHEQKRNDRPTYVNYYGDRTSEDAQFSPVSGNMLGTAYDTYSIMHYPSCMFATTSPCNASTPLAWVLERKTGAPYIKSWSDRPIDEVLSDGDLCGVRRLYGLSCDGEDAGAVIEDAGIGPDDAGVDEQEGCVPATCLDLAAPCGSYDDGCGGVVSCGACAEAAPKPDPDAGSPAATTPSMACVPAQCGAKCGVVEDGCGATLDCGSCAEVSAPVEGGGCGIAPLSAPSLLALYLALRSRAFRSRRRKSSASMLSTGA